MATRSDQHLANEKGKRNGVVLPWRQDQKPPEDLHGVAVVAAHRSEEPVPLGEMKRRRQRKPGHIVAVKPSVEKDLRPLPRPTVERLLRRSPAPNNDSLPSSAWCVRRRVSMVILPLHSVPAR